MMTAVFVLVMLGAMLTFVFAEKEDVSYYENRTLAKPPEVTWEGALDGSLFSDIGA